MLTSREKREQNKTEETSQEPIDITYTHTQAQKEGKEQNKCNLFYVSCVCAVFVGVLIDKSPLVESIAES